MIELSPHTAIMVYLCAALIALLSIWLFGHLKSPRNITPPLQSHLKVCEYCQGTYLASTADPVSKCPICKSLNH